MEPEKELAYPLQTWRAACTEILEPLIRIAGLVGTIIGRNSDGVELRVRGLLLGGRAGWRIGRNVRFVGSRKRICLGRAVVFYGNAYVNAGGPVGRLTIGAGSHIDQFCVLYAQGRLEIGEDCAIASSVSIYTQSNKDVLHDETPVAKQPTYYAPVKIGSGSWLGTGCRILPGITLGSNVHVGAGAVVTKDFEENAVVVGVPARSLHAR